jgi:hypothetical protein
MNMEWKPPSFHLLPYMVIKRKIKDKRKKPHECCGSVPPLAIAIGGREGQQASSYGYCGQAH